MNESILKAKKASVDRLSKELSTAQCAIIVTYHNLNVAATNQLRKILKDNDGKLEVSKNTLVKRALDGENFKALDVCLSGPNALITCKEETKALMPVLQFAMAHKEMEVKAAVIGGSYCDPDKIKVLAFIPDKETAVSALLGTLQSPVVQFACALKAVADNLPKAA